MDTPVLRERILSLFEYDAAEGRLFWKVSRGAVAAGQEAGCVFSIGYRCVMIDGKNYLTHRLIFLIENGYLPECLDHIDNDKLNNRICNLREASHSQNMQNRSKLSSNTSDIPCVHWHKHSKKWRARCADRTGKKTHLGLFTNKHFAAEAVRQFRLEHHGEFAKEFWLPVDEGAIEFLASKLNLFKT